MKDMILLVDMAYIAINPEVVVIPSSQYPENLEKPLT
jgi:hypothetical protein